MPGNVLQVRVWCEDRAHERFVREFAKVHLGVHGRKIEFHVAPSGQGSAAQWVILRYSAEVIREARMTRNQTRLAFLVVVDGDVVGVDGRRRSLDGGPDPGSRDGRIALWVPTRNTETWILWLCSELVNGSPVSERDRYGDRIARPAYSELIRRAVAAWNPPRPEELPSLAAARREIANWPIN